MFNFFKKKDKDVNKEGGSPSATEEAAWGAPSTRKMSKEEAAKDAAEQVLIEQRNKERRDMYRVAGQERVFNDSDGRRLALRVEVFDGTPSPLHPPVAILAFWGVKQIGTLQAEAHDGQLLVTSFKTEGGFERRGIDAELLREAETYARTNGLSVLSYDCPSPDTLDCNESLFAQHGYTLQNGRMVKSI